MADFNQILTPGNVEEGVVNVVVEIPKGSTLKIEWRRDQAIFEIDRIEPAIFAKPASYGFIPQTLDEDGDELDVLVICDEPIPMGVALQGRVIGVMKFEDDGEVDDKIIVVPVDDRTTGNRIQSLEDISQLVKQIENHFSHYKDLKKPGSTVVKGWGDVEEAKKIVHEAIERWNNQ